MQRGMALETPDEQKATNVVHIVVVEDAGKGCAEWERSGKSG